MCENKGTTDNWLVRKLISDLEALGHVGVILKSDGELALLQVMQELKGGGLKPALCNIPRLMIAEGTRLQKKLSMNHHGQYGRLR